MKNANTTTWLVATVTRYVLVDARNESLARERAMPLLEDLYADFREKYCNHPIVIHTVRPAADDEIELWNWHHEMLAREHRANTTDS